jgi:hypothetical protein
MKTIALASSFVALVLVASPVAAAGGDGEWTPDAARARVGADYELWPTADFVGMVWGVNGHIPVLPKLFVDADFAWGYVSSDNFKQATHGNLTAGAHYTDFLLPDLSFHAGGTLTLPLLADPPLYIAVASAFLTVTRDYVEAHRLVTNAMPLRFGGGIEWRLMPNLFLRADLVPTIYIPVKGGVDTELFIDQINEIEYRLDMGFGGGLRLQEAFTLTTNDLVQIAMEPFVGYRSRGPGVFGRLGLLVALDKPAGFGFDRDKLATVRLAGGYQW